MTHECELVEGQARPTLVVRTRTAVERLPEVMGPAWGAVMAHAGGLGAAPSDAPFAAYHNTDMQDLDVEIGFTFAERLEGEGEVQAGEIPAGKAVQCIHVGPYDQLGSTHAAVEAWCAERGLQYAGPPHEFYVDDPQETPEEELRTRVVVPVR